MVIRNHRKIHADHCATPLPHGHSIGKGNAVSLDLPNLVYQSTKAFAARTGLQEVLFDTKTALGVWKRRTESYRMEGADARTGEIDHKNAGIRQKPVG